MGDPYMGQLYGLSLTNGLGVPKNELDGVAWLYIVQQSGFKLSEGSSRKIQDLNSIDQSRLLERIEELKSLISTNKLPSAVKVESN